MMSLKSKKRLQELKKSSIKDHSLIKGPPIKGRKASRNFLGGRYVFVAKLKQ